MQFIIDCYSFSISIYFWMNYETCTSHPPSHTNSFPSSFSCLRATWGALARDVLVQWLTDGYYNHKCCVEAFLPSLWAAYGKLCILCRQLLVHRACCDTQGESCGTGGGMGMFWGQYCVGAARLGNVGSVTSICQLRFSNKELNLCTVRLQFWMCLNSAGNNERELVKGLTPKMFVLITLSSKMTKMVFLQYWLMAV